MNNVATTILITIFVQLIVFAACTISPYLSMHGLFFGVSLEDKLRKDKKVRLYTCQYLLLCSAAFILLMGASLWYITGSTTQKSEIYSILLPLFIFLGLNFLFYVRTYHRIKEFAREHTKEPAGSGKTIIDTAMIQDKNKLKHYFRRLYFIPLVLVLGNAALLLINYQTLPDMLIIHWNFYGVADKWHNKSMYHLAMLSLMQLLTIAALFYCSDHIFTSRGHISTENYDSDKKVFLRYLKGMGYSMFAITLCINLIFLLTTIATIKHTNLGIYFTLFCLILPFIAGIYMIIVWLSYRKNTSHASGYMPDKEDANWILGSFYYNPNDPSLFVEKRYGIGWTINIGLPVGKAILIATILLIIGCIIFPFFFK